MTAIVTDVQIEINAVLGVEEPDPRLITTGQTSGRSCVDGKFFKSVYVIDPLSVRVIVSPNPVV